MVDLKVQEGAELEIDFSYRHPTYRRMYANWVKNRDFVKGSDYVKRRSYGDLHRYEDDQALFSSTFTNFDDIEGTAYLPVPKGMQAEPKLYRDYRDRAQLYNASGMTVESYEGMLYRKPPVFQYEPRDGELEDEIKDKVLRKVTPDNKSFTDLCRLVSREVIITNKVGMLVDFPDTMREKELSVLEYEELNLTPKASVYSAEKIINWHNTNLDDEIIPDYFVLDESYYGLNKETMKHEWIEQYRILFLEDTGDDYIYHQMVVEKADNKKQSSRAKYVVVSHIVPEKNNAPMNRIPFYVIDKDGLNYSETEESIINDLVDVNMGHFRNSADWEHNLFYLGLKTLVLPGYDVEERGAPTIGGIITGPTGFDPFLIEPSSDSGLEKEMQNKEQRMSVLGSQAISQRGKYVQSAATAKINSATETSILGALANAQSNVMTVILNLILGWSGYENIRGNVHINTDFFDDLITPESALKFAQLLQSGSISPQTYFYNLSKRDFFPPEWSWDKEITNILDSELPMLDQGLVFKNSPVRDNNSTAEGRKFESKPDPDEDQMAQEKQQFGL